MWHSDRRQIAEIRARAEALLLTGLDPETLEAAAMELRGADPFDPLVAALMDKVATIRILKHCVRTALAAAPADDAGLLRPLAAQFRIFDAGQVAVA